MPTVRASIPAPTTKPSIPAPTTSASALAAPPRWLATLDVPEFERRVARACKGRGWHLDDTFARPPIVTITLGDPPGGYVMFATGLGAEQSYTPDVAVAHYAGASVHVFVLGQAHAVLDEVLADIVR